MRARRLIASASFGPRAMQAIGKAFDDAWAEIEPTIDGNPLMVEAARLNLANIVLSLAKEDSPAEEIKAEAVRRFRLERHNPD